MAQESAWENEYRNPLLITKESEPQKDVLRFLKFLRKDEGVDLEGLNVLDLGCGTGRNANYLAELGASVTGIDISKTALDLARKRADEAGLKVRYLHRSMGDRFPVDDASVDLIFDITSSNSLNESERRSYLAECDRVLKSGGHMFLKTLNKDGDKNAKALLGSSPGPEKDTYVNRDMNLVERVFSREDLLGLYSPFYEILSIKPKTSYTRYNNQSYKRNFWLVYMRKA